jgi:parvulin-like peptidyl-prolyl isomerase
MKPITLICAVAVLTSCSKQAPPNYLAKVGSREIRADDLRSEAERRRNNRKPVPAKDALLDEMVKYETVLERARRMGLHEEPQVRRELNNLLVGKFLERELAPRLNAIEVSAEEIKAEYERNIAKYQQPAKVRLALLYIECDQNATEVRRQEARSRLEEARQKVASRDGFGKLAIDYSEDQASRYRGGDIGWIDGASAPTRLPKVLVQKGLELPQGQCSEIIDMEKGFYVVMKTDSRGETTTPLVKVESSLRQALLGRKRRAAEETFRQEIARIVGVQMNHAALAAVELPKEEKARGEPQPPVMAASGN